MRIIAGNYRGKKLKQPKSSIIRPTLDRFKEDLFNIINHHYKDNLINGNVLDLFAGSGALGIESISRGAKKAVFIDNNNESQALVKDNLRSINNLENSVVIKADSCKINLEFLNLQFSLIFIDPPYDSDLVLLSVESLLQQNIFQKDCIFVVESNKDIEVDALLLEVNKKISNKILKIYRYKN